MPASEPHTAVVTGGTRGIGEGVARALAGAGWRVVAGGLGEAEVAGFAPDPMIEAVRLDVTDDAFGRGADRALPAHRCAGKLRRDPPEERRI